MRYNYDITLQNDTSESKAVELFSRQNTNSKNLTKYGFSTPYYSSYPASTYFRIFDGLENYEFTLEESRTPAQIVTILNELNIGTWVLHASNATDGNVFYITSDRNVSEMELILGTSWSAISTGSSEDHTRLFFLSEDIGWVGGNNGEVLKTIDGADNWTDFNSPCNDNINDLYFWSALEGIILPEQTGNAADGLNKTTDGATSWHRPTGVGSYVFKSIAVPDAGNNVVLITNIWPYSSSDKCESVAVIFDADPGGCNEIYFVDTNNGWCVNSSGQILYSSNGGAAWTVIATLTGKDLNSVCFLDANTGFVCGTNGYIGKSVNGGVNWTQKTSGTSYELTRIRFLNSNIGYAIGKNAGAGIILKTQDGGDTWTIELETTEELNDIQIISEILIYIAASNGKIYKYS